MKHSKKVIKILAFCFFLISMESLYAFDKEDIISIDTEFKINQEKWPDWSMKLRKQGNSSLAPTEEQDSVLICLEMAYPLNHYWKAGLESEIVPVSVPSVYDLFQSYDLNLAYTQPLLKGMLFAQLKSSLGLTLAILKRDTLQAKMSNQEYAEYLQAISADNEPSGQGAFLGSNVGISVGLDFYAHPWFALTAEAGYQAHHLFYNKYTRQVFLANNSQVSLGFKTIF